ncbi:unnamed protein product [Gordionus sp. m RMFG-2023]
MFQLSVGDSFEKSMSGLYRKNWGPLMEQDHNTRSTQKGVAKRLAREFVDSALGGPKKAHLQPVPLTSRLTDKEESIDRTDIINIRTVMEQHRAASMVCPVPPMIVEPRPLTRMDSDENLWEDLLLM